MSIRLQILTGGKGGIGKTLFSLSSILSYMYQSLPVLAIDLNYHNLDLYEIFQSASDNDAPLGTTGFRICRIVGPNNVNHYLVYPGRSNGGAISKAGRLPCGALGVYDDINQILKKVGEGTGVEPGFSPVTCIVDTGFHLFNLNASGESSELLEERLPYLLNTKPYIWFVWTLASLQRSKEIELGRDALRWLKGLPSLDPARPGQWFNETENLIHVITPNAIPPKFNWINFPPQGDTCIKALEALLDSRRQILMPGGMDYTGFCASVGKAAMEFPGQTREQWFESLALAIAYPEGQRLGVDSPMQRPSNVYVNPHFIRSLTGYTDGWEQHPMTIHKIYQEIEPVYNAIRHCLAAYGDK
jgi:hypothetical protein